jgi:hypothetical protein
VTHDELSRKLEGLWHDSYKAPGYMILRTVVELHHPTPEGRYPKVLCQGCSMTEVNLYADYPCQTIRIIEKELN